MASYKSRKNLEKILRKSPNSNSNLKYKISSGNKKFSLINFLLILKNAFLIFASMLFSYIYIPYYLIMIFLNTHKKNFLEMINNEDFTLISSNKDS